MHPTWPLLVLWLYFFSMIFAGVERLLSKRIMSCCASHFLVLWLEKSGFCLEFLSALGISRFLASKCQVWVMTCKAIRKLRKLPRIFSLNLSVPSQSSYFFKLSKSSYVSFKYVMTLQFFIVTRIGKCAFTLNFWKKFKFVLKDDCGGSMVDGIRNHSGWGPGPLRGRQ